MDSLQVKGLLRSLVYGTSESLHNERVRRYTFLGKESVYGALNQLRNAFLAAKDGTEVEEIIKAVLTFDERMKIGRRIQVANLFLSGLTFQEIVSELKVGRSTVAQVERQLDSYKAAFESIQKREEKVEREYKTKSRIFLGGSKLFNKPSIFSGFTRKKVKR